MSIGDICNRSVKAAHISMQCQIDITEYCNRYAKKLLGNNDFEFDSLPDSIVENVFYGADTPNERWASFLKKEVKISLKLMGFNL